jgi:L-seryl-tRNA(Ser) seleniumtransferase
VSAQKDFVGDVQMKLRNIPPIHSLLEKPVFLTLISQYSRSRVKQMLTDTINHIRTHSEDYEDEDLQPENLATLVDTRLKTQSQPSLKRIINATGTILHTNLGRAPLAEEAIRAMAEVSRGYCNLEMDLQSGKRGMRSNHVNDLLCELTSAEASFAVNNNAGAVLLVLAALASGKEVIVSRGELIEIGGKFRIPDVMEMSGAILREVGTTNRTHLSDYENAITDKTGLMLKAHQSNFKIMGFTQEIDMKDLIQLGSKHGVPVIFDLGSGSFVDGTEIGWNAPRVDTCIADGIDIVTFSGDKLLGGPQAGLILGRGELIEKISQHPLARALRLDKTTLAALEATLTIYLDPGSAWQKIPALRIMSSPVTEIKRRAQRVARVIRKRNLPDLDIQVASDTAPVGGGALPLFELPTTVLEVTSPSRTPQELLTAFRQCSPPIICRISREILKLDFRTVNGPEMKHIIDAFSEIFRF